jgi:hypothetical protein
MSCIERGTRWMLLERNSPSTWLMAKAQVEAFLDSLYAEGAFSGRTGELSYFVVCDERINNEETVRAGKVNLAFGFAASKPGEYHAFIVTHQGGESRARPITMNRFANYSPSIDHEIESSILRGLVPHDPVAAAETVRMPRPEEVEATVKMPPRKASSEAV